MRLTHVHYNSVQQLRARYRKGLQHHKHPPVDLCLVVPCLYQGCKRLIFFNLRHCFARPAISNIYIIIYILEIEIQSRPINRYQQMSKNRNDLKFIFARTGFSRSFYIPGLYVEDERPKETKMAHFHRRHKYGSKQTNCYFQKNCYNQIRQKLTK